MTDEQEVEVVKLLRRHAEFDKGCDCGWWEQDGFDHADHLARLIRNYLGHR